MPEPKIKVINGQEFKISQPYEAGHVLNDAEAKALNQTRSENIGNNLRSLVKEAVELSEKGDNSKLNELSDLVAKYDAEYTFALGGGGVSTRKLDPLEREAKEIANEIIKADLAKKGRKLSQVPEGMSKEEWAEKLDATREMLMGKDEVLKAAKKRLAEKNKLAEGGLEALGL